MLKMDKAMMDFRDNIDAWVKEIKSEMDELSIIPAVVGENIDTIQKHDETINDLKQEIRDLKQELQVMKLMTMKQFFEEKAEQEKMHKLKQ